MSDPQAKASRSKAKDARQTPAPDGVCTGPKRKPKKEKPWGVYGPLFYHDKREFCWHKAQTEEAARDWASKASRSGWAKAAEFEIKRIQK